jgi:hypothetical protein
MSINRIVIFLFVGGYLFVNISIQMVFFAGPPNVVHNIWSKYKIATTWQDALRIAQDAYYAKTGWLVILLLLQAFSVPFGLALGLSFACYAIAMLIFFDFNPSTTAYAVAAVALLASYFVKWQRSNRAHDKV